MLWADAKITRISKGAFTNKDKSKFANGLTLARADPANGLQTMIHGYDHIAFLQILDCDFALCCKDARPGHKTGDHGRPINRIIWCKMGVIIGVNAVERDRLNIVIV